MTDADTPGSLTESREQVPAGAHSLPMLSSKSKPDVSECGPVPQTLLLFNRELSAACKSSSGGIVACHPVWVTFGSLMVLFQGCTGAELSQPIWQREATHSAVPARVGFPLQKDRHGKGAARFGEWQ